MPNFGYKHRPEALEKMRGPRPQSRGPRPSMRNRPWSEARRKAYEDSKLSLAERFWPKVDIRDPSECWPYRPKMNQFSVEGRGVKVARVAFYLTYGRWPEPMACHTCDYPTCCNPDHLFEGTNADNMADMVAKGRSVNCGKGGGGPRMGEVNGRAKLSNDDVIAIRRRYSIATAKELAVEFSVTVRYLHMVATGQVRKQK